MPAFEEYQVMIVSEELAKIFADMPEMTRMAGMIKVPGGRHLKPKVVINAESWAWINDNILSIVDENCDKEHPGVVVTKRSWKCMKCQTSCTHRDQAITVGRAIVTNADTIRRQLSPA